jgi:hypothetical protein
MKNLLGSEEKCCSGSSVLSPINEESRLDYQALDSHIFVLSEEFWCRMLIPLPLLPVLRQKLPSHRVFNVKTSLRWFGSETAAERR